MPETIIASDVFRRGCHIKALSESRAGLCPIFKKGEGDSVSSVQTKQPGTGIEKKIGGTTYVVTSHFKNQGSTAVDKIKSLLNTNIKPRGSCHKS